MSIIPVSLRGGSPISGRRSRNPRRLLPPRVPLTWVAARRFAEAAGYRRRTAIPSAPATRPRRSMRHGALVAHRSHAWFNLHGSDSTAESRGDRKEGGVRGGV